MKDREPPHTPAGLRRALRCLSLLLLPVMIIDDGLARHGLRSTIRPTAEPTPYLPILGSPSLRFQEELPPPDLGTRPAASAPPVPALTPAESSVAVANTDAIRATNVAVPPANFAPKLPPPPVPVDRTPSPILPDTTRPVVHPEDFLPFFQIPGSARQSGDVIIASPGSSSVPAPGALPPSSATYTQTPQ